MLVFYQIMKAKQPIIALYKNRGETPLECILRFKKQNSEYENEKMTYAGRLDPLAEGLLLVLVGEECKSKEKYLCLDKTYEVDVLLGFATDTCDVLGVVQSKVYKVNIKNGGLALRSEAGKGESSVFETEIQKVAQSFVGKFTQKYPPFSSKTIKGKSLFSLFKSGELNDDEIPTKEVEIKSIELLGERTISKEDLYKYIIDSVNSVSGDFRQEEILESWKYTMVNFQPEDFSFPIISLEVTCTSGTYMRSLANSIGEKVDIPALALNIKRVKVGGFML